MFTDTTVPVSRHHPVSGDTLIKAAAIQYRATPFNKAENIRCLSALVDEAAVNGARIIVLPEMCTTGMSIPSRDEAAALAETIPGPTTAAFAALARRDEACLVLGMAEADTATGRFFNTQVVLGPDGLIIGRYRKIHLFGPDLHWAESGDMGYRAVDTPWGRIGLGICCDINYWEFVGYLSAQRVDVFAFSTNWVGDDLPFPYWTEMIAGGRYYVIAANNWGAEGDLRFSGGSTILAPDGTVLARSGTASNCILYAVITTTEQELAP